MFGIRELTHVSIDRKEKKLNLDNPYIAVTIAREIGALEIGMDSLKYHTLTPGGNIKSFDMPMSDTIEVVVEPAVFKGLKKWAHYEVPMGHIRVVDLNNRMFADFFFYNIENSLEKVKEVFEEVFKNYDNNIVK